MGSGESDVCGRLRSWLTAENVPFEEKHHEPTFTSEQSAAARGESLDIGGKALVVKVDDVFRLFVLPADRKLASGLVRKHFSAKAIRFASKDELLQLTGLVPGSIPPFGRPILELDLSLDERLSRNERIAFNAASLTTSFVMAMSDYLRAARPTIIAISE